MSRDAFHKFKTCEHTHAAELTAQTKHSSAEGMAAYPTPSLSAGSIFFVSVNKVGIYFFIEAIKGQPCHYECPVLSLGNRPHAQLSQKKV